MLNKYLQPTAMQYLKKTPAKEILPIDPRKAKFENEGHKKSLKSRRNLKLLKAMNDVQDDTDPGLNKTEEEKRSGSKNSTASVEQNVVLSLMKKSNSQSQSAKRSSDQPEKLSSLSDLRGNSDSRSPNHKAKTEHSFSDNKSRSGNENTNLLTKLPLHTMSNRKDSEDTHKTDNVRKPKKLSAAGQFLHTHQRSKSFSKVPRRRHRHE